MPAAPYRGIQSFRYADHAIFFARERETRLLASLVDVYRGVFLYGDSGNGKSSLVNAGLLPHALALGFDPVRVRVQPRAGEELVVEQIAMSDDSAQLLPCALAADLDDSARVVLSIAEFEARVRAASHEHHPLIVFDQFEEILTLFEDADAVASRGALAEMIIRLLREELPVKLLFAFREDYLGRVKQLLRARPELVDQALRLGPPPAGALATIISGPFERFPGRFERELEPALARRLRVALAERFGIGEVSLSEVQTVCLRLWRSPDPESLLVEKGVQGLLEDELGEALEAFTPELRAAAVALLSQMVTSAGTRNIVSAEDLRQRVREEDGRIPVALVDEALERLERDSKLVRCERRRDVYLYEITSEFLVPWISRRREGLRLAQERRRGRRRLRILGSIGGGLLILAFVAVLAILAIGRAGQLQRSEDEAQSRLRATTSFTLALSAVEPLKTRPDVSLLLALEAFRADPSRAEARSSALAALTAARDPGVVGILHGHDAAVGSVVFKRDGRTLASVGGDDTVRSWDVGTRKAIGQPLTGRDTAVRRVALSPDGRMLAYAGLDKRIRLWDVPASKPLGRPLRGHTGAVNRVLFSPDGRTLASGSADKTIRLWDVGTRRPLGALTGHTGPVLGLAFSDEGTLASAGDDGTIRLWAVAARTPLGAPLRGGRDPASSVALSRDGRTLAAGGVDHAIRLWNARTGRPLGRPLRGHGGAVYGLAFSRDGRTLASAGGFDRTVGLWDVRTHKPIGAPLGGHTDAVYSVAFSRDGRTLASASKDGTIRLWDVREYKRLITPLIGRTKDHLSVAFSLDARTLAYSGVGKTVRLWDVNAHRPLGRPLNGHTGSAYAVAISADARRLASTGGHNRKLRTWDMGDRKRRGLPLAGHNTHSVRGLAVSPGGHTLASGGYDGTVRLWDMRARQQIGKLIGHENPVETLVFSPDGKTLASAADFERTVRLWDVRARRQIGKLTGPAGAVEAVAFSRDGRRIAFGGYDGTVRLWDVRARKQIGDPLTGHTGSLANLAFSPDGATLASAADDKTIWLWDVRTRKPIGTPLTFPSTIAALVFAAERGSLLAAGYDGTIRRWETVLWRNADELQTEVCKLVGSGLSETEWSQYAGAIKYRQSCR